MRTIADGIVSQSQQLLRLPIFRGLLERDLEMGHRLLKFPALKIGFAEFRLETRNVRFPVSQRAQQSDRFGGLALAQETIGLLYVRDSLTANRLRRGHQRPCKGG